MAIFFDGINVSGSVDAMISAPEEQRAFETMKPDLVKRHPGQFAVFCERRLLGIYDSADDALAASSRAFDAGTLPEGADLFISEIAEQASLRVTARPYPRATSVRKRSVSAF
jgi:hypothetical protein